MVDIHLYGELRKYSRDFASGRDIVLWMRPHAGETVASLMRRAEIPIEEINHIFLNSKLLVTRSQMGALFGLPQVGSKVLEWDLDVPVKDEDRIGLFGLDMPILGM